MKKILLIALAGVLALGVTTSCHKDTKVFVVTFNSEGGSAVTSQNVDDSKHATRPTDPTRDGYTFLGWFSAATGGTEWNFTTNVVLSDMTLHAHWDTDDRAISELISTVQEYDSTAYTTASWEALQGALNSAIEVAGNASATPAQIAEALKNLQDAVEALVPIGDKSLLENAITMADLRKEENNTPESWAPFAEALAKAKDVYADTQATQPEVDAAIAALEEAYDNLVPVGGGEGAKDALEAAIRVAEQLNSGAYTSTSWIPFAEALANAEEVDADPNATMSDIEGALEALNRAIDGLVEDNNSSTVADKTTLRARITYGDGLVEADYTASTWANFESALANAKSVAGKASATQAQVNAAVTSLNNAIAGLDHVVINDPNSDPTADKSALVTFIDDANHLNQSDYTPDSWSVLQQALGNAVGVNNNSDATQAQVDAAYNALQAAINDLVKNQDSGVVRDLINQLTSLVNALPSASLIKSNPLLVALTIVPATLADGVRDTLVPLLGGVDNTVVDGLNSTLDGILAALGLTNLI